MSIRDIKLKVLRIIERYLRRFADYVFAMTSEPDDTSSGLPEDWLDLARRAQGPMISYGGDADAPPAGLPPASGKVASKRSSLTRRSRPVQQDIGQNNEETETAGTTDRPPSRPDAHF